MATEFEPIQALLGGLLIGLAAALLLVGTGRIAGISGILGRALLPATESRSWRVLFLLGLPLGAGLARALGADLPLHLAAGTPLLIVAGLLVGFGTQLGNGCTSGHGVCGISRGSRRSIAATVTFMAVAAAVVFVVRHVGGAAT